MNKQTLTYAETIAAWARLWHERDPMGEALMQGAVRLLAASASYEAIAYAARRFGLAWTSKQVVGPLIYTFKVRLRSSVPALLLLSALAGSELYYADRLETKEARIAHLLKHEFGGNGTLATAGFVRPGADDIELGDLMAALVLSLGYWDPAKRENHVGAAMFYTYLDSLQQVITQALIERFGEDPSKTTPAVLCERIGVLHSYRVASPFTPETTRALKGAYHEFIHVADDPTLRAGRQGLIEGLIFPFGGMISMRFTALLTAIYGVAKAGRLAIVTSDPSTGSFFDAEKTKALVHFLIDTNASFADFLKRHKDDLDPIIDFILSGKAEQSSARPIYLALRDEDYLTLEDQFHVSLLQGVIYDKATA